MKTTRDEVTRFKSPYSFYESIIFFREYTPDEIERKLVELKITKGIDSTHLEQLRIYLTNISILKKEQFKVFRLQKPGFDPNIIFEKIVDNKCLLIVVEEKVWKWKNLQSKINNRYEQIRTELFKVHL
jgi:hypothetical protein